MSQHDHPIWQILDKLQMDNREQAAKLIELRSYVAGLNLTMPKLHKCPECGATHRGPNTLAEHRYHVHNGPIPDHYLAAERRAGINDTPLEDEILASYETDEERERYLEALTFVKGAMEAASEGKGGKLG